MIDAIRNATRASSPSAWRGLALAALAVGLLTLLPAGPAVQAQTPIIDRSLPPLADLAISAAPTTTNRHWNISVHTNGVGQHPPAVFRNVQVQFSSDVAHPPGVTGYDAKLQFETEETKSGTSGHFDPKTRIWTIPRVPAYNGIPVEGKLSAGAATNTLGISGTMAVRVTATIIGSTPAEPPGFQSNNAVDGWYLAATTCVSACGLFANGDATADITGISNRFPQAGGATTFTVTAASFDSRTHHAPYTRRANRIPDDRYIFDLLAVQLRIDLSDGLTFAGVPTAPTGTTFHPTTGIWDIGALDSDTPLSLPVAVRLTADSIPLEERCLTATVIRAVPWFAADVEKRVNDIATLCLGEGTEVELNGNELGGTVLFQHRDCVGSTSPPCTSADTLELVVEDNALRPTSEFWPWQVSPGLAFGESSSLKPEQVTVHVHPEARHEGKWWTGRTPTHTRGPDTPGPKVYYDYVFSGFSKYTFAISDVSPRQRPGSFSIEFGKTVNYNLVNTADKLVDGPYDPGSTETSKSIPLFLTFGALGTYKIQVTVGATKAGTAYTDSGVYTFHVGPMAELAVRDAGAIHGVDADQRAYTLMAVNNGPDTAPAVQVRVTGAHEGAEAIASQGSYDPDTGVWTIGALRTSDFHRGGYAGDGPTLTLITDDASAAPITATIANTQDYTICIDGDDDTVAAASEAACTATTGNTWHTTPYYDRIERNNTATIAAHAGLGPHPDASRELTVQSTPVGNIVMWEPVATVNGFGVTHYEVQYSDRSWRALRDDIVGTVAFDQGRRSAGQLYRVRAVNIFGVPGPWAMSTQANVLLPPTVPRSFGAALITDSDVQLTWRAAHADEAVNGYTIQVADHAGGPWSTLARLPGDATRWVHTGLPASGATKFYRIRAHNRSQPSEWAEASVALATPPDDAPAPTGLRAQRYTTGQGNHGIQVWFTERYTCDPNQPTDRDAEGYVGCRTVIEFREVGSNAWRFGSEDFGEYGIVPWDPDAHYFTQGDGRSYAVRLDTAYDIRVCKLNENELETKLRGGAADGTWCVGEPTGRVRVPAGE